MLDLSALIAWRDRSSGLDEGTFFLLGWRQSAATPDRLNWYVSLIARVHFGTKKRGAAGASAPLAVTSTL